MPVGRKRLLSRAWMVVMLLAGCVPVQGGAASVPSAPVLPAPTVTSLPAPTPTAFQAVDAPQATASPAPAGLWVSGDLPQAFLEQFQPPAGWATADSAAEAALRLEFLHEPDADGGTRWVYVLAGPFPTVEDGISTRRLRALWTGSAQGQDAGRKLLVSAETRRVITAWGEWGSSGSSVRVVEEASLLETAWNTPGAWAILPFDQLAPRWKALAIDGVSPFASDSSAYELALPIGYTGTETALAELRQAGMAALPQNRDPALLTTLLMTGVTALSRHIGEAMEEHNVLYPAQKVQSWFDAADLTHISNEVSFYQDCPRPGPLRADMRFCSAPKYMALLEAVGADVIELTGNHNLDWGQDPYRFSLDLYRQAGMAVYGGGLTLLDAQQPLTIEHHGNRLAFLGCSPAGPETVWATPDKPGSAPCDFVKMEQQIMELRAAGYLPVVTLQAVETDTYNPGVAQGKPVYRRLARAGAVIVSGSQAHVPQTMTFVEDHFVHYGLGNLFFDQMEPERARQNFIDLHIFYNGRYLGVELLTTMLEDSAQPRPMTVRERRAFLEEIFSLSDWSEE